MNGAASLVRVLASEDETWVRIDDGLNTARFVLNAGEFFEDFYGASIRVTSNRPVLVGQFGVGSQQPPTSNARDPIFIQMFPNNLFATRHRFYSPEDYENLVNVVAPIGAIVELDGTPVTGFTSMPGETHQFAAIPLDAGEHTLTSTQPIMGYAYGYRLLAGYGYPTGISIRETQSEGLLFLFVVAMLVVTLAVLANA